MTLFFLPLDIFDISYDKKLKEEVLIQMEQV